MSSGSAPSNSTPYSFGHALAAAGAEDVLGVAALRADVHRHVLDDAEDRHADLLEHLEALAASSSAMSCGVVTITAPVTGTAAPA
jgi:hypothetical protein